MNLQEYINKCIVIFSNQDNWILLLQGALISLFVAACSWLIGMILGVIGAACKLSKSKILRFLGNVYVEIVRGTPMLLQILLFYLVLPTIITLITGEPFRVNKLLIGIIAIGINSGAYSTELIRSGIMGIDNGQWEACKALNLNYIQTMRYIILPQAFKQVVPPMVSEFITLIKDSSLLSTIGVMDLLYSAQVTGANYYNYLPPLLMASCMYLVMTFTVSFVAKKVERRLAESD